MTTLQSLPSLSAPSSSTATGSTVDPTSSRQQHQPQQAQQEDLWSSILDSVKGSKQVQTRQCIVLGQSLFPSPTLPSLARSPLLLPVLVLGLNKLITSLSTGAPNSGKSTLVSRLATSTGEPSTRNGHENTSHSNANGPLSNGTHGQGQGNRLDLGMGFEVLDVRDEGDEGGSSLFSFLSPLRSSSPPITWPHG